MDIKKEICDLLIFLLNKRQDYLISNTIAWFKSLEKKFPKGFSTKAVMGKFKKEINENLITVLPKTMKTGILSIDQATEESTKQKKKKSGFGNLIGMRKEKVFQSYTEESLVVPDLNVLYTGN